jgi:hypothetical protein
MHTYYLICPACTAISVMDIDDGLKQVSIRPANSIEVSKYFLNFIILVQLQ